MSESKRGGARIGAGRKPLGETSLKRIPIELLPTVNSMIAHFRGALPADVLPIMLNPSRLSVPVAGDTVQAGFPSPAAPYLSDYLDFNDYLVNNPAATIAVYVKGDSMMNIGMDGGDMLVVDRSIEAQHRDIVIAEVDGEFTVKRLIRTSGGIELHPENDDFPIIKPRNGSMVTLVGVVLYTIKKVKNTR